MTTLVARLTFRNLRICYQIIFVNACKTSLTATTIVIPCCFLGRCVSAVLFVFLLPSVLHVQALHAQAVVHPYLSPGAIATTQVLLSPNESRSENASFEWLLERTAKENGLNIWCDRRVARDKIVTIKPTDESQPMATIEQSLTAACDQVDAAILPLDGVIAVVPKSKRDVLATVYWKLIVSKKSNALAMAKSKLKPWDKGTQASDLLEQFRSVHLPSISKIIEIEHDIWPAFDFRDATVASVSVCLLGGFDLCLVENEQGLVIEPLSEWEASLGNDLLVEWLYDQKLIDRTKEEDRKAWKLRWPDSKGVRNAKPLGSRMTATAMAHYDFAKLLTPPRPKPDKNSTKVFSGTIKADLPRLIDWMANRFQLEFYPLPLPAEYATKQIDLDVKEITMDELLSLVAKKASIEFKKSGKRVEVVFPDR